MGDPVSVPDPSDTSQRLIALERPPQAGIRRTINGVIVETGNPGSERMWLGMLPDRLLREPMGDAGTILTLDEASLIAEALQECVAWSRYESFWPGEGPARVEEQ